MEENKIVDIDNKEKEQTETKTYTEKELESEVERRVKSMSLKKDKENKKAQEEAIKLANMNAEEKLKYEFEQREKIQAEKEREWTLKENKYEASKILNEKGLPIPFADFVVAEDAETMMSNIKLFDTEFKKAVKAEVESRLKSTTPKTSTVGLEQGMTKEKLSKLSYEQQVAYLEEHPDFI